MFFTCQSNKKYNKIKNICGSYISLKSNCRYMNKLNLIAVGNIVVAVSLIVGMTTPAAAFAQDNLTMTLDDNMSPMGNMTSGNATSMTGNMTETESLPSAGETGYSGNGLGPHERGGGQVFDP